MAQNDMFNLDMQWLYIIIINSCDEIFHNVITIVYFSMHEAFIVGLYDQIAFKYDDIVHYMYDIVHVNVCIHGREVMNLLHV